MLPADPVRRWLLGLGLAGLLLGVYFTVWGTTVRSAYIAHVARPVLEAAPSAPDAWTLHTTGNGRVVALALGLWGVAAGFAVHAVASRYLVDAFGLGVAVLSTVRVFGLGEGVSPPRASS